MLYMLFSIVGDRYALPAKEIVEAIPVAALKKVPGAPAYLAGLLNYHGQPVPVIDLSAMVMDIPSQQRLSTRILLVHNPLSNGHTRLLGLMVYFTRL
jgi:chemotaxis-related protein WspB